MKKQLILSFVIMMIINFSGCNDIISSKIESDNAVKRNFLALVSMISNMPEPEGTYPYELINPEHQIVTAGSTATMACVSSFSGAGYSFRWTIAHAPEGSTAALSSETNNSTTLTTDLDGFYLVKFTLYKNGAAFATDYAYVGTPSVCHYVREGAAGANNGSNWNDAWTNLPSLPGAGTLVRGHTYYIADGSYQPMCYVNTPENGIIPIYIKKATASDHGTGTGWDAGYGDGQAVWEVSDPIIYDDLEPTHYRSIPFIVDASYIIIDGQFGSGTGTHGFRFSNNSIVDNDIAHMAFVIGDGYSGNPSSVHHVKIKHCEMNNHDRNRFNVGTHTFYTHSRILSVRSLLLHNCYIHDTPGVSIYLMHTTNSLIEYCYVARNHSDAGRDTPHEDPAHAEAVYTTPDCNNNIVRYSTFEDIEGTGIIVGKSGWQVYGNLAFYTPAYVNTPKLGRHTPGIECNNFVGQGLFSGLYDCVVYNNTVVGNNLLIANDPNNHDAGNLGLFMWHSSNIAYNNIWANCYRVELNSLSDSNYNIFYKNRDIVAKPGQEANSQTVPDTTTLFINAAGYDYHLNVNTNDGLHLSSPYDYDMDGIVRGAGGNWSRGAYQYH